MDYLALGDALTVDYQPGRGEDRTGGFVEPSCRTGAAATRRRS
jgi:hypothetical protein